MVYYVSAVHTVGNHCGTTNVGTAVTIGPVAGTSVAEGMRVDSAVTVGTGVYDACTANGVPADNGVSDRTGVAAGLGVLGRAPDSLASCEFSGVAGD